MFLRGSITWIAALAWLSGLAPVAHSDEVCDGAASADANGNPTQQQQHCQTAASADEGATADKVTAGVWAGVAGVCTYACAAVGTSEYVCTGAQVTGTATEAAATRDLQSSLTGIAGAGTSLATSQASQGAQQGGQQGAQRNIGACTSAATAALQTVTKVQSMRNAQSTAQTSRDAARELASNSPSALSSGSRAESQGASAGGGFVATEERAQRNSACAGVSGNSSHASIVQCAMANDRRLPSFVGSPRFASELQKRTGMSLPEMVNRVDHPAPLLTQAMGGAFGGNSAGVSKLAASLTQLERNGPAADSVGGSMYSSGGGAGMSGSDSGDVDLAAIGQMMSGMMQQMNPDQAKEDPYKSGVGAVIFANQHRSPASVAEDRSLGIFDRITYRYYYVGRRIVLGEGLK